uniref:fumarylacetoacetase n=1 Tax=Caulobacter sp. (strain K31) TaxID=366602 RepID=B0T5J1_CAUSK
MLKPPIDETHDPSRRSWVSSAQGSAFPIQNLPLGVFSPAGGLPRGGVAIGDQILDLLDVSESGYFEGEARSAAEAAARPDLTSYLGLKASARLALRRRLSQLLSDPTHQAALTPYLHAASDCALLMPVRVANYTDFFAGAHHAVNAGKMLRPDAPLSPNYKHVPIAYHGRASSIRPSGTPVRRPWGQVLPGGAQAPELRQTRRLDYEFELGLWVGAGNALGEPLPIAQAGEHLVGLCILNDFSARDLQAWEAQPLGPFLSKNFLSVISPWIVTVEALAPFRAAQRARPQEDPPPLAYLWDEADQAGGALAIALEAFLSTSAMRQAGLAPDRIGLGHAAHLYWTPAQMIAHHTVGGCDLGPGDLLGTGTISAPDAPDVSGAGCLLEMTKAGRQPITLSSGETRGFLADGDEILLRATARAAGFVDIGFGECRAQVAPANEEA